MNLKLITTETFGELPCNFYRNANDDVLLTREQIGQALEYADPIKAIQNIHAKHKDRLDQFSVRIKSETFDHPQSEVGRKNNLMTERVYYTERGIMELCRWSRQPKANLFMDWVWDIVEKYRNNDLPMYKELYTTISQLTAAVSTLQKEVSDLKTERLPRKRFSYWSGKMFPKYQLLSEYFGISNSELYRNLYEKLKASDPEIDLNQLVDDYCYENKLESCYTLEAIERNIPIRTKFEKLVDNLLVKYNLSLKETVTIRSKTIFDTEEE